MDTTQIKIRQLMFTYHEIFNQDPKWTFFEKNILPTLITLKCHFCQQIFSSDFGLKRHYSTFHVGKLPSGVFYSTTEKYRCNVCNKTFSRQDKLNEHISNSKEHKQALESQSNCLAPIDQLMRLSNKTQQQQQQKRKHQNDHEQDDDDDIIFIDSKKVNLEQQQKNKQTTPNRIAINNQVNSNEANSNKAANLVEAIDPLYCDVNKLTKEQLQSVSIILEDVYFNLQMQLYSIGKKLKEFN